MTPSAYPIDRRRALADDVHDVVRNMLMDGLIVPGKRVVIESLARELDVSPTPVREALARLESEGLVIKQALKGYTAAPLLDRSGFSNLFEMRRILEPEAAALAAVRITPDGMAAIEESLQNMHIGGAEVHFEEYRDFVEQDAKFHAVIADSSGNPLLSEAITRLRPHMPLYRLLFKSGFAEESHTEHDAIVQALRSHNPEAAALAMRLHIENARSRIDQYFQGLPAEPAPVNRKSDS